MQPSIQITELDGALGIAPPSGARLLGVVGPATSGPIDVPATFARPSDLVAAYGAGPGVEAAARHMTKGFPVLFVRTGNTTPGSFPGAAAVTEVGTGTSTMTVDNVGTAPNDDYDFYFRVVAGGTIGTAGITFTWSLDGGRTQSPVTALGTATSFIFPGSGGVLVNLSAGTMVAGDTFTFRGVAPKWNGTELGTALDAVFASTVPCKIIEIAGAIDAAAIDIINPKFVAGRNVGKNKLWVGNTRVPNAGETGAAYKTALDTALGAKASTYGVLCAGEARMTSGVNGRTYRRPVAFEVASQLASVDEHVNTADVNLGPLDVSIRDENGNAIAHDESLNPGLDDSRFCVLRTWEGLQGVYVNRPLLFSAAGSDFDIAPKRRVMNLAHDTLRPVMIRRLNRDIQVNKTTGFIDEGEAKDIEAELSAVLGGALLAAPKASGVTASVSRTDNILSTKTITVGISIVPLAYPETIKEEIGFTNPALSVQTV